MVFGVFEVKYMKITQVTLNELQVFDLEVQMLVLRSFPSTPQSPKSKGGALSLMRFPGFIQRICYSCFPKCRNRHYFSSESSSKTWTSGAERIFSGAEGVSQLCVPAQQIFHRSIPLADFFKEYSLLTSKRAEIKPKA